MLIWMILRSAVRALLANKLRSFLAMLGIIIGVGAVISMLAIGSGARAEIMQQMSMLGTDLLALRAQSSRDRGVASEEGMPLSVEDAASILSQLPKVLRVAPVVSGWVQLVHFNRNAGTNLSGTTVTYFPARNFEIEYGRLFTEREDLSARRVVVLGRKVVENLFDGRDPTGETIRINRTTFRVVGSLKAKGDQGFFNPDDQVFVPLAVAIRQVLGRDQLREVNVQARPGVSLEDLQEEVAQVMRWRHGIREGKSDDFYVRNYAEIVETAKEVSGTFTYLLGSIASISLLVGGIGIMNIMLVTVTERTREIGIRKAIGAKQRDILRQFLLESCMMSGVGGVLGAAAGVGSAIVIGHLTTFRTEVHLSSVLIALAFSAAVGVFFGYYPARRAARLDPVETLRYE